MTSLFFRLWWRNDIHFVWWTESGSFTMGSRAMILWYHRNAATCRLMTKVIQINLNISSMWLIYIAFVFIELSDSPHPPYTSSFCLVKGSQILMHNIRGFASDASLYSILYRQFHCLHLTSLIFTLLCLFLSFYFPSPDSSQKWSEHIPEASYLVLSVFPWNYRVALVPNYFKI